MKQMNAKSVSGFHRLINVADAHLKLTNLFWKLLRFAISRSSENTFKISSSESENPIHGDISQCSPTISCRSDKNKEEAVELQFSTFDEEGEKVELMINYKLWNHRICFFKKLSCCWKPIYESLPARKGLKHKILGTFWRLFNDINSFSDTQTVKQM